MQPDIIGHKTLYDEEARRFRHEPLKADEAHAILQAVDAAEKKRAADMPTERDAINAMFEAYQRLRDVWKGRDIRAYDQLGHQGGDCVALGLTKDGKPRHPLYMRTDAQPVPFGWRRPV